MRNTYLLLGLILTIIGSVMNMRQTMNFCAQFFGRTQCNNTRGCSWDSTDQVCYPVWFNPHPIG